MWFLIKASFWLGLVILFLPTPEGATPSGGPQVSAMETLGVLNAAVRDAKGFCERNPDACVTGAAAMQNFGYKAQNGAKMLHELISEKLEENRHLTPPKGSAPASRPLAQTQPHG